MRPDHDVMVWELGLHSVDDNDLGERFVAMRSRGFTASDPSKITGAPIAVVNLIDTKRQFFKAEVGLGVRSTPLETAFCRHALLEEDVLIIPYATKDTRLTCNPLVTGEPHIRSYAGALMKTDDGHPIATVCVLDYSVREFTEDQVECFAFWRGKP